ncbi:hypothetical protein EDD93_6204 [Streptomyces sp. 840.1]|uniref:hypothetical protein n=1 Tax=Streptomyces sp. 840.1 TaxID=2485152 RepID=UPI000F496447|nr:hypothetical protein [Streptomyces sp. 840.1]ROQ63459.1 hypothetical protein EDD93_6204 [Streptomyces sp. 840.1]
MRHPFLAGAAVVITTAALAACGSSSASPGGGGEKTVGAGPAASAPAGPAAGASAEPDGSAPAAPRASRSSAVPKTPTDELTPATGTFTRKEKKYLVDRVPRGMDPAAVLQSGQETCDRLTYLVKVDRDIAIGAVATGEIADAEPAAGQLCTQHRGLVEQAARAYPDGTYRGARLRPGRYRDVAPTKNCGWEVTGANGRVLASGSSDDGKRSSVTIPATARAFTSTGCYAWLPEGGNG